jgi:hypothetical protein
MLGKEVATCLLLVWMGSCFAMSRALHCS